MIRSLVAQDKQLLSYAGKLFDLTYVLPNVIAMAFPATGISQQWRNSRNDVAEFLNKNHPNHFRIWNLTEDQYDTTPFHSNVVHAGFLNHHPPQFNWLVKIIQEIQTYLKEDPMNTAVIHCLAGRGRTGIVVCSLLLALGTVKTTKEALEMFGERRSKKRKGVTSPCQVRWVYYFECYIRRFFNFEAIPQHHLQIMRITTFNFEFKISGFEDARPIYYFNPLSHFNINPPLLYVQQELNQLNEKFVTYFPENIISGDVVIVFAFSSKGKIYIVGKLMFNTFFLQPNTIYRYSMTQMQDPTKGSNRNKYKLSKDCRIEMETKSVRNKEETMKLVKQIESGFEVLNTIDEIVKQRNNSNNKEATHKSIIPPNYPIPPPI